MLIAFVEWFNSKGRKLDSDSVADSEAAASDLAAFLTAVRKAARASAPKNAASFTLRIEHSETLVNTMRTKLVKGK